MLACLGDAEENGAIFAYNTPFTGGQVGSSSSSSRSAAVSYCSLITFQNAFASTSPLSELGSTLPFTPSTTLLSFSSPPPTSSSPLLQVQPGGTIVVQVGGMDLACDVLVNSAGLAAVPLFQSLQGLPPTAQQTIPPSYHYCKGSYFRLGYGESISYSGRGRIIGRRRKYYYAGLL